jgi:hypothetical protein
MTLPFLKRKVAEYETLSYRQRRRARHRKWKASPRYCAIPSYRIGFRIAWRYN